METATALRKKRIDAVDLDYIAEELEDLGRTEQRELRNRLKQLMLHLLKWKYQPKRRGVSWKAAVNAQRKEIVRLLRENPSLKGSLTVLMSDAYPVAVDLAVSQARLPYNVFPPECPFTFEEAMTTPLIPHPPKRPKRPKQNY